VRVAGPTMTYATSFAMTQGSNQNVEEHRLRKQNLNFRSGTEIWKENQRWQGSGTVVAQRRARKEEPFVPRGIKAIGAQGSLSADMFNWAEGHYKSPSVN
jgi:hypothetical protein